MTVYAFTLYGSMLCSHWTVVLSINLQLISCVDWEIILFCLYLRGLDYLSVLSL